MLLDSNFFLTDAWFINPASNDELIIFGGDMNAANDGVKSYSFDSMRGFIMSTDALAGSCLSFTFAYVNPTSFLDVAITYPESINVRAL